MKNFFSGSTIVDFWVWINPQHWLTQHQLRETQQLFSAGLLGDITSNLPYIPNPEFKNRDMSIFQHNIINYYEVEYKLELERINFFQNYPSRLNALYLFPSKKEAKEYQILHPEHIGNRVLLHCQNKGDYYYSIHDLSWIDFLRMALMLDDRSLHSIAQSYWKGIEVEACTLELKGKPWTQEPIMEALYIGTVQFSMSDIDNLYIK